MAVALNLWIRKAKICLRYTVWKFQQQDFTWNQYFAILGAVSSDFFGQFQSSKSEQMHKNQNSEPLNGLEWNILHFKNPQNWFHVKSEW